MARISRVLFINVLIIESQLKHHIVRKVHIFKARYWPSGDI